MLEALAILKAAEELMNLAKNLIEAAKAKGDPVTDDVVAQMARSQASNDRRHRIDSGRPPRGGCNRPFNPRADRRRPRLVTDGRH